MTTPRVETDRIVAWLQDLVRIPSVGPENAGPRSGDWGEAKIAAHLVDWFEAFGGDVHQEHVLPGRPNVYGLWRGRSDRWVAVDVHIDTVGVETMPGDPFEGRLERGRVYGRGAVDDKAALGVVLAMLEAMHRDGAAPSANLLIAATADEETGARGAPVFADWVRRRGIRLDQLMVCEPTLCTPIYGHKGSVGIELEIHGLAVHSSKPELGKNAIVATASLVLALDEEHRRLIALPASTEVGTGTLSVSVIHGGQAVNIVPETCRLLLDRRLVPGEDPASIAEDLFDYARANCPLPVTMKTTHQLTAFYQQPDTPWIRQLHALSGMAPTVAPYGTNAWAYGGLADECVILGPGSIDQAHRDEEWVEVAELEKLAGILTRWWGLAPS